MLYKLHPAIVESGGYFFPMFVIKFIGVIRFLDAMLNARRYSDAKWTIWWYMCTLGIIMVAFSASWDRDVFDILLSISRPIQIKGFEY